MSLERHWQRITPVSAALYAPSLIFRAIAAARRGAYRAALLKTERLPVPVIIVGNITVGGTGKTPLVLWLVTLLARHGMRPAIVSRGYGGDLASPRPVTAASDPARVGDEPVLLAQRSGCPVWVGADRVAAARALLAAHPACDVIVSDDGLQHYRLARDVELAVVDGARGLGNGLMLPAGPLREPAARLREVDAVVINGTAREVPEARCVTAMQLKGVSFIMSSIRSMSSVPNISSDSACTRSPASAIRRAFSLTCTSSASNSKHGLSRIITRIRRAISLTRAARPS